MQQRANGKGERMNRRTCSLSAMHIGGEAESRGWRYRRRASLRLLWGLASCAALATMLVATGTGQTAEQPEAKKKVKIKMLVEHDAWRVTCLDDESVRVRGGMGWAYRSLRRAFPVGHAYRITGDMGWSVTLTIAADGSRKVTDVQAGPYLAEAPPASVADDGAFEVRFGRVPAFHFRIPVDWGRWKIDGAYEMRAGFRHVELPNGTWTLEAEDWTVPLRVAEGKLSLGGAPEGVDRRDIRIHDGAVLALPHKDPDLAPKPAPEKPLGYLTTYHSKRKRLDFRPVRTSPLRVHGQDLELPADTFAGVGSGKGAVLAVTARPTDAGLACDARFLRGGKEWAVTGTLRPLDRSSPAEPVAVPLTPGEAVTTALDLPSGAYLLEAEARAPDGGAFCTARVVVALKGNSRATASLWLPEGRTAYRAGEKIDIAVWHEAARPLSLVARREGMVQALAACGRNRAIRIQPDAFSPGEVELQLRAGEEVLARRAITILPEARRSDFLIMSYASVLDQYDAVEKLDALGITGFLEQRGTRFGTRGRLDGVSRGLAECAQWLPAIGPADRYAPPRDRFLEFLDRKRWRIYAQWGSAHQPWGYGISFRDPIVVNRLAASSAWTTMAGRQHPCFMGMNVFDEGGTARGPRPYNDATYIEYDHFEKEFGRPRPRYAGEDREAARAWIYDKQRQHHNVYAGIGEVLDQINRFADPGAFAYLGTQNGNLNSMAVDGGHPPIAYKSITLSTMHWYPGYFRKSFILLGNEYHFMQPQTIEFMPLIWSDNDFTLTRHEVNLAVSRQVDGIAHFHWKKMIPRAYFAGKETEEVKRYVQGYRALHKRLERIGGLLRTIRRDRDAEVAVLYSLYDFAPKLLPTKDDAKHAYKEAYHAAYTGYCTLASLLHAGLQAGWLCEEEILRDRALARRKVLILPEITEMMPALRRRIRAFLDNGGTVFVDEGTRVDLPDAKKLPVDFGKLARTSKLPEERGGRNFAPLFLPDVVPVMREHVAPLVDHVVETNAPLDLLVTRQVNGEAEYFLGVNENMLPEEDVPGFKLYRRQKEWEPLQASLTLPARGAVYNMLSGERIEAGDGGAHANVDLAEGELCVYGVLPEPIGGIELTAPRGVHRGDAAPLRATLRGASGEVLRAAVPLEVRFLSAKGEPVRGVRLRSTDNGAWQGRFTAGLFDPGIVRVEVRETLTGQTAHADIEIADAGALATPLDGPVIAENAAAMETFFRAKAVYELPTLLNGERADYAALFEDDLKAVYIALGDHAPPAEAVQRLAQFLEAQGVDVEIRRASDLAVKGFDDFVGRGVYRIREPIRRVDDDIEVDRPVIAIGSAQDNALVRLALWHRRWTYRTSLGGFPAPGQAYVAHLWRPFSLHYDAVIAAANDPDGVAAAAGFLMQAAKDAYAVSR